jgi:adenylate cyclase
LSDKKTFWVEFIGDRSVKIEEGQSILEAALEAGIPHYHDCGGVGQCTTCRVLIHEGVERLTPPNEVEQNLHSNIFFPPNVRLACQTFVNDAPVMLHRIIRDEIDLAIYIDDNEKQASQEIGMEKELALFFLDIRNFTPFMQAYLPFDVIHVMRRLFGLFKKCIEDNHGKVIETAGDGLYAVFGLHEDLDVAVSGSIQAGQSILKELEEFNRNYVETHFNHQFEIGIGVHAGRVIIGNIGLGINNNLTVMGLPVNIASRLQNATKQLNNSFVISDYVFKLAGCIEGDVYLEKIKLKGVKGEFQVHLIGRPYVGS